MSEETGITRRTVVLGAAGAAAAGALSGPVSVAMGAPKGPLWKAAQRRGIVYGAAMATWQEDADFRRLFKRQAALLFTQDDFLWYVLKPSKDAPIDFTASDKIVALAEQNKQLVFAAHLVWDEGFGDKWDVDEISKMSADEARSLLFGVLEPTVQRYKGRVAGWIVVNEGIDPEGKNGFRTEYPWYQSIGPSYMLEAFQRTRAIDPNATLVLNEFGFETVNQYGDRPGPRRKAALQVIDKLQHDGAPLDAFGIQAHLLADRFHERFNAKAYRHFLRELAHRGLKILITELDVLDDGLPKARKPRDRAIAEIYKRYLDVTLHEPAVKSVMTFGISDRFTWLEEDYPRDDGGHRRPLPYDDKLKPKPAHKALLRSLHHARKRKALWTPPRSL
jgi:endo-1,4-beta-xylanase